MKVLAIKNVEPFGNLWAVRYTRLTKRGVKQDAYYTYYTRDEAQAKRAELLLDMVQQHDGLSGGKKAKQKARMSLINPPDEQCECLCHQKPEGWALAKCPLNCRHCKHCQPEADLRQPAR
jgi:hypothetical protein